MRPPNMPSNPERTYKDVGWQGWGHWLGNSKRPRQQAAEPPSELTSAPTRKPVGAPTGKPASVPTGELPAELGSKPKSKAKGEHVRCTHMGRMYLSSKPTSEPASKQTTHQNPPNTDKLPGAKAAPVHAQPAADTPRKPRAKVPSNKFMPFEDALLVARSAGPYESGYIETEHGLFSWFR